MQVDVTRAVRQLFTLARARGYVTYDELNEALPSDQVTSEEIEDVMAALSEGGIILCERSPELNAGDPDPVVEIPIAAELPLTCEDACERGARRLETALAALRHGRVEFACALMDAALAELKPFRSQCGTVSE